LKFETFTVFVMWDPCSWEVLWTLSF